MLRSRSPTRARRYPIPLDALHALVDGGLQDLEQRRYADFDELRGYCRRSRARSASRASPSTAPTEAAARRDARRSRCS